ncbi:MAG: hypothetical protein ACRDHX_14500 [Chloroflexota bacterium]
MHSSNRAGAPLLGGLGHALAAAWGGLVSLGLNVWFQLAIAVLLIAALLASELLRPHAAVRVVATRSVLFRASMVLLAIFCIVQSARFIRLF